MWVYCRLAWRAHSGEICGDDSRHAVHQRADRDDDVVIVGTDDHYRNAKVMIRFVYGLTESASSLVCRETE